MICQEGAVVAGLEAPIFSQSRRRKDSAATGKKRKRQADSNAKAVRDEIAKSGSEDYA